MLKETSIAIIREVFLPDEQDVEFITRSCEELLSTFKQFDLSKIDKTRMLTIILDLSNSLKEHLHKLNNKEKEEKIYKVVSFVLKNELVVNE